MPVPSTVADLSSTASSNYPSGSESIGTSLDDYLRAHASIIKQVSDAKADASTAVTLTGTQTLQNKTLDGTNSLSGNLSLTGTGARITGDFSNATVANRVMFQSSTTNGATSVAAIPNGTGTSAGFVSLYGSSGNYSYLEMKVDSSSGQLAIVGNATGSGTQYPMTFYTSGSERMRIATGGVLAVGRTGGFTGAETASVNGYATFGNDAAPQVILGNTGSSTGVVGTYSNHPVEIRSNNVERMRIETSGYVKSISNAKAWVNFNGTLSGTITPRANLNIASVTKNGTGDYTLNITAGVLADANYAICGAVQRGGTNDDSHLAIANAASPTTTSCRVTVVSNAVSNDASVICVTIFGN